MHTFTSPGSLTTDHNVIFQYHSSWRLLPDLTCHPVHHHRKQELTSDVIPPPELEPICDCYLTPYRCLVVLICPALLITADFLVRYLKYLHQTCLFNYKYII